MQALLDLDADGGVVGLPFEDLIGTVAVDGSLHRFVPVRRAAAYRRRFRRGICGGFHSAADGHPFVDLDFIGSRPSVFVLFLRRSVKLLGTSHGKALPRNCWQSWPS